ncbi:MAG: hypothetical protein KF852_20225 [Saprospiraceae bacterium]|nr:hypothetical protein [Saprospiraceae bacterium]
MENSNIIVILRTFSPAESRKCRKWLLSPAHNQREDTVQLYDYLMSGAHLEQEKFLQKERVFVKIFPDQPYDDARLRQAVHFLLKAVEDFLVYEESQSDEVRRRLDLARVFRQRQLDKLYQKAFRQAEELQESVPHRNAYYLRNEYLLQREQYAFLSEKQKQRAMPLNLTEMSEALDRSFMADKLRQACLMLAHQAVYKAEYDMKLLQEALQYVEQKQWLDEPAIGIYYYGYRALTERDQSEHFDQLKQKILTGAHLFPSSEARDIYLMAINYCIARMNAGAEAFIREAFELYRKGFEERLLIENDTISRWTFLNVIMIALTLSEFEWAESFIESYQDFLEETHKDNFVHFSRALLLYEKREYGQAMLLLNTADYDDMLINLRSKALLMKMFYEQNMTDSLESLLEATRTYMTRKKVMAYHKAFFSNLVQLTKKLLRTNPYDQEQKNKLKEEILQANPLTSKERNWLLEQLGKRK